MKLSKSIAQKIVEEMMNVLPYNINVMNEDGVIIGSGDLSRIGTIHEGAKEAIDSKKLNVIYHEEKGVKPGVNEPIIIDNKVIGVIGITGYLEEVKKFIKLVRVTAVLLIEQAKMDEEIQDRRLGMERFYHELAYRKINYDVEFYERAEKYGLNLKKCYQAVLAYGNINSYDFKRLRRKYPDNCDLDNNKVAFFIEDKYKYKQLLENLTSCASIRKIGIGGRETICAFSLENAEKAVEVGSKIKPLCKVYDYEELKFLIHLSSDTKEDVILLYENLGKYSNKLELIETIQAYIEEDGEINDTAARLNIHRNTLNYRLERIKQLTGKNPKNTFQLFELLCGLIWR